MQIQMFQQDSKSASEEIAESKKKINEWREKYHAETFPLQEELDSLTEKLKKQKK